MSETSEILRRAAGLMRERAEAAMTDRWWTAREIADGLYAFDSYANQENDAAHIESWHPAVALAVSDWLDAHGMDLATSGRIASCDSPSDVQQALKVASAYLGADA